MWFSITHDAIMHEPTHFKGLDVKEVDVSMEIIDHFEGLIRDHVIMHGKEPDQLTLTHDMVAELKHASEESSGKKFDQVPTEFMGIMIRIKD